MANPIPVEPTGSPSITRVARAPAPSRRNRTPIIDRPTGTAPSDSTIVCSPEGVVVEHQVVVLDEEAQARVAVAEGVEHTTLVRRPVHGGGHIPNSGPRWPPRPAPAGRTSAGGSDSADRGGAACAR